MSSVLDWLASVAMGAADTVFGGVYSEEEQEEVERVANLYYRCNEQLMSLREVYNSLGTEEGGDQGIIKACYSNITEECYGTNGDVLSKILEELNSVPNTIESTIRSPLNDAIQILNTAQRDVEAYDSAFCSKHSGWLGGVTSIL